MTPGSADADESVEVSFRPPWWLVPLILSIVTLLLILAFFGLVALTSGCR